MKATCFWCALPAFATSIPTLPKQQRPLQAASTDSRTPLLVWHGLGDTYVTNITLLLTNFSFDSDGINLVGALLNDTIGPTYTYNIRLAEDGHDDQSATFFGNVTEQIAQVCSSIAADPVLNTSSVANAIGFSQGGQFMRAYVETCNKPPVKNLVTFGSQHNGITQFNNCEDSGVGPIICGVWESLLETQTWTGYVQSKLVPAQYYRSLEDMENYLSYSNWLADVNNEREAKNETYKKNLKGLEKFWMYIFTEDTVVVPPESAWFDDVVGTAGGEERNVTKLRERKLYQEDWLGLKALDEKGALEFKTAEGGHMQITNELLVDVFEMMYKEGKEEL